MKIQALQITIDAMIRLGAKRENISAAIGPCISQASYEVGQEFFETFADESPDYTRFFINGKGVCWGHEAPRDGLRDAIKVAQQSLPADAEDGAAASDL